jgi:hypothetical protein
MTRKENQFLVLKGLKEAGGVIEAAAKWWVVRADQH